MNTPNFLRPLQLHQLLLRSRPPRGSNSCFYEEVVNVGKREAKESWEAVTCHVLHSYVKIICYPHRPSSVLLTFPLTIKRVRDVFELDSAYWSRHMGNGNFHNMTVTEIFRQINFGKFKTCWKLEHVFSSHLQIQISKYTINLIVMLWLARNKT